VGEPYARRNVGRSVRPEHIARFHDEYGACEWERFDLSSMDRVGLEVHLRLLRALAELLRVTKPGGSLLLTVMSLLGTARAYFEQLSGLVDEFGWQRAVVDVFETGDLDGELNKGHVLRLYRWSSLEQLLGRHPCRIITASAANFLSARNDAWDERFLEIELQACREPGALDGGTHIVVVLERT